MKSFWSPKKEWGNLYRPSPKVFKTKFDIGIRWSREEEDSYLESSPSMSHAEKYGLLHNYTDNKLAKIIPHTPRAKNKWILPREFYTYLQSLYLLLPRLIFWLNLQQLSENMKFKREHARTIHASCNTDHHHPHDILPCQLDYKGAYCVQGWKHLSVIWISESPQELWDVICQHVIHSLYHLWLQLLKLVNIIAT